MTPSQVLHFDAFRDMINAGLGREASSLNLMLHSPIELDVPSIRLLHSNQPRRSNFKKLVSSVRIGFHGPFSGTALLAFSPESAARLVGALVGHAPPPVAFTALMSETLNEVGNILINCIIGSMGNILAKPFDFVLPVYLEGTCEELLEYPVRPTGERTILQVLTRFQTGRLNIEADLYLLFELDRFDPLIALLDGPHQ